MLRSQEMVAEYNGCLNINHNITFSPLGQSMGFFSVAGCH